MKKETFITLIAIVTLFSCYHAIPAQTDPLIKTEKQTIDVPYTVAHNYFINNDVKSVPAKITSQAEFEKYFGMAAVMGEDGMPTNIDFAKQFVIAADAGVTSKDVELTPASLAKEGKELNFSYNIKEGDERSYATHPFILIIVSKEYDANVKLNAIKK